MKKLFLILSMIGLIATPALAEDTKPTPAATPVQKTEPAKEVMSIGFPINTSGIQIAGRPDTLKFISIKSDNKIEINWENVCKMTTQHAFDVADLQKINGEFLVYIVPYLIKEANNGQHKC